MNKEYKIKLDLNKKLYNKKMTFNQFDENVNDFYIEVTKNNEVVKDLDKSIVTLVAIKPNGQVDAQFIEIKEGQVYADLKPSMCDLVGNYQAKAMIVLEEEIVTTDTISYSVNEDKIISKLNDGMVSDERFTILNDMLSRLSTIEINEANRENNFSKIQEEFEAIKNNHNELVATQTDRKVIELLDPVIERVDNKINQADNKISEVNEFVEAKEIEIDKNLDENTKKINDKIIDIEYKALISTNKVDVAISKIPPKSELIGPQGPQGPIGPQGIKGDTPSITHLETTVSNKVNEIETRFNTLTSKQQQSSEVIDARDGEVSLKLRLERDIEKINNLEESATSEVVSESDFITVENTSNGYFEDVKLEGKTLVNLASLDKVKINHTFTEGGSRYVCNVLNHGMLPIDVTKEYTFIFNVTKCDINRNLVINQYGAVANMAFPFASFPNGTGLYVVKLKSKPNHVINDNSIYVTIGCGGDNSVASDFECSVIILEGDHTQNPPEYFEGLKSAGQDVDEISVLSYNENLFDKEYCYKKSLENDKNGDITRFYENGKDIIRFNQDNTRMVLHDNFKENTQYTIKLKMRKAIDNVSEARLRVVYSDLTTTESALSTDYTEFVEVEHTTYENKTVLRVENYYGQAKNFSEIDLDSVVIVEGTEIKDIQRKQDKKRILYYNDETQTWEKPILRQWDSIEKHSDNKYHYHVRSEEVPYTEGDETKVDHITDMTTTVKKISTEKVYECTDLDLITYSGETNLLVKSGVLNPKVTLKVKKGIGNVVTMLQNKVAMLEDLVSKLIQNK